MKLISVNVGQTRAVEYNGKMIQTGISKEPISGRARVGSINIEGDRQADLSVHGGVNMAVYAYSADDYEFWQSELPGHKLPWGAFGENLTISGISDEAVHIGDTFQIDEVLLQVTQPRIPCYKLGIKFGDQKMVKRFLGARRTGFYLKVLNEGDVKSGDSVELISRDELGVRVRDIVDIYAGEVNQELLQRALNVEALPLSWKDHIQNLIG